MNSSLRTASSFDTYVPEAAEELLVFARRALSMEMEEIPLRAPSRQDTLESQRRRPPLRSTLKRLWGKYSEVSTCRTLKHVRLARLLAFEVGWCG